MFSFTGFSTRSSIAINLAIQHASEMGHRIVGTEHLILALLDQRCGVAFEVLDQMGVEFYAYRAKIIGVEGLAPPTNLTHRETNVQCAEILSLSVERAKDEGAPFAETEHILGALLCCSKCFGLELLKDMGVDLASVADALLERIESATLVNPARRASRRRAAHSTRSTAESKTPMLNRYSKDLTAVAKDGSLDPLLCRDLEVSRVLQILVRRTKNNPCLIGEAGVGKTAIVEGLAQRIANDDVPDMLRGKRIVSLDLTGMLAGAKFRGDFEERIHGVLREARNAKDVILFIDELHTVIGAGSSEGSIDAANILKPALARGELQLIGATTIAEYRKYIEKDTALERRFQSVQVDEPSEESAITILQGLRPRYEQHHNLTITDEAVTAAVKLSARYLTDRFLPDKAIDLLDGAAARARLTGAATSIGEEEVAQLVAEDTGIDATALTQAQSERLLNLENELSQRIVGQSQAISAIANAVRRSRVGLGDAHRPIGSFIFLGPTGVGKTELCLALAESLFFKKESLIRLDMSEYMERHSVSKLTGSPPGYVGYDEMGQLTERVRRNPYSLVLFDEIEKAHPDVHNILLQILEDGTLTDSHGRSINFKNTLIVMTSNVGAVNITERNGLGFTNTSHQGPDNNEVHRDVMKELKRQFRPEFINRVDDIIVFNKLSADDIRGIAQKMLDQLKLKAQAIGFDLEFTENALSNLSAEGYDTKYGARPLRRLLQKRIEVQLASKVLQGEVAAGDRCLCDYAVGDYTFTKV